MERKVLAEAYKMAPPWGNTDEQLLAEFDKQLEVCNMYMLTLTHSPPLTLLPFLLCLSIYYMIAICGNSLSYICCHIYRHFCLFFVVIIIAIIIAIIIINTTT